MNDPLWSDCHSHRKDVNPDRQTLSVCLCLTVWEKEKKKRKKVKEGTEGESILERTVCF